MFSVTRCQAIVADMLEAFTVGGEVAAMNEFDNAMNYWDTDGEYRDWFTAHVMDGYRKLQPCRV